MSATVNKPMNKELKDANVEKKLQLYGIVSAFRNGKLPSVRLDPTLVPFPGPSSLC